MASLANIKQQLDSFLFLEDVVRIAGCSERHIREEIKRGLLKASKPGKRLRFRADDVSAWLSRKTVKSL